MNRETSDQESAEAQLHAAIAVCERLRQPLVTFAGAEGFRSLLSRALTLSKGQEPSLCVLIVNLDGKIQLKEPNTKLGPNAHGNAGILLIGHLLFLLTTFIGQSLTFQLVQQTWPDLGDLNREDGNSV